MQTESTGVGQAALVERLVRIAPKLIKRAHLRSQIPANLEECVFHARLAYDTLAHLGIEGEPLDCTVTVWNARFEAYRQTGVDHPDAYRHSNDPSVLMRSGIDASAGVKMHSVVVVPSTWQLVDLSAWQLSRPGRSIQLPGAPVSAVGR